MRWLPTARFLIVLLTGCGPDDCLPVPPNDTSPPVITITLTFARNGREITQQFTDPDTSVTVNASSSTPVKIVYSSSDPSGMRRMLPGLTIQQSVALGVDRRFIDIPPVEAGCPVPLLRAERMIPGTGERRTAAVTAAAQNWVGGRKTIHPINVRLE